MATRYLVLRRRSPDQGAAADADRELWERLPEPVIASSAEAAVRAVAAGSRGDYVAVPERSFAPLSLSVERTERTVVKPLRPAKPRAKATT